jgi:lysozyme
MLIKQFEGCIKYPYTCPAGKLTIGFGHVVQLLSESKILSKLPLDDISIERLLLQDLKVAENAINTLVKVPLKQQQFDAISSLVYNWGTANFKSSKGLKALNQGDYITAASEFFSKDRGVVKVNGKITKGLVNRRAAEFALWNL